MEWREKESHVCSQDGITEDRRGGGENICLSYEKPTVFVEVTVDNRFLKETLLLCTLINNLAVAGVLGESNV